MIVGENAQLIPFICIFYVFKSLRDIRIHGLLDQKHGQKAPHLDTHQKDCPII
jgi:hypothetical protein